MALYLPSALRSEIEMPKNLFLQIVPIITKKLIKLALFLPIVPILTSCQVGNSDNYATIVPTSGVISLPTHSKPQLPVYYLSESDTPRDIAIKYDQSIRILLEELDYYRNLIIEFNKLQEAKKNDQDDQGSLGQ